MTKWNLIGLVAAAPLALVACGGEATAELNLMDAPPAGVTAVKLTVASMQVHVEDKDKAKDADPADASIDDDTKWVSLTVGKQIDLVQKQGETAAEKLGELGLPEGKITQIRLLLDTSKPENNTLSADGKECNLDVTKVAKKGIKINHAFKALETKAGSKHQVWVDFELDKSLKKASGECWELDPKLRLAHVKTDGKDETL